MKRFISATFVVILLSLVLIFQNCAGFNTESASGNFSSSTKLLLDSSSVVEAGGAIRFTARLHLFPQDSQVLWDHQFGDGLTYCVQTTSFDKSSTVFVCPTEGTLKVLLNVKPRDQAEETYVSEVYVKAEGADPGQPSDPPAPINGVSLYNMYCSGCHQAVTTSPKRGTTLSALSAAISSVPQMRTPSLQALSEGERQAIVQALQ